MPLEIQLPTGVTLVAELLTPSTGGENKLAVCLHPYGRLGGNMNDGVLQAVTEPLLEYGYHVLKYNSRGIGGSTGKPSLTGLPEGEDLEAIVDWATQQIQDIESIIILGYSYGSLMSTLFPNSGSIRTSHVLISYPLGARAVLIGPSNVKTYEEKLTSIAQNPDGNLLVIFGDRDQFTPAKTYKEWADTLRLDAEDGAKLEIFTVPGATHSWGGETEEKLVSHVRGWLQEYS